MKNIKKKIIIMLTLIFTVGMLGGCGKGSKEVSSMGRYIEESLTLPEEITYVNEINTLDDGSIALIAYGAGEGQELLYFISNDGGNTWESKELSLPKGEGNLVPVTSTTKLMKDGSVFVVYSMQDMSKFENIDYESMTDEERVEYEEEMAAFYENMEYSAVKIGVDGSKTEINVPNDISNTLYDVLIDGNNMFYNDNESGALVQRDLTTGEVKNEYKDESGWIQTWCKNGDNIILGSHEKITTMDINTGKEKSKIENKDAEVYRDIRLYSGNEPGEVYSCTESGVFKVEGKGLTQIIDGSLSTFGDRTSYLQNFLVTGSNEFLALFNGQEGNDIRLIRYKFQGDIASRPENQITVYSMFENDIIRQAIVMYQKQNPDVYINLETGINGYSMEEQNISDAIKRLNTEIMAGKGPDILVLDNLPSKVYIEKGLLADISDIFGGKDNEELFTNLIYESEGENNKVYTAPVNFNLPVIYGKNASGVDSLNSLAAGIEEIANKAETTILEVFEPAEIIYLLYSSCGANWVNNDKTINKENIKGFLENTKVIFDSVVSKHSEEAVAKYEENKKEMEQYLEDMSYAEANFSEYYGGPHLLLENRLELVIGQLSGTQDIEMIEGIKESNKDIAYDVWRGQDVNSVKPMCVVGVNAKSEKQDIAKDFIKLLFSEEYQKTMIYYGLPTNKKVFKNNLTGAYEKGEYNHTMGFGNEDGEMFQIELKKLSEEKVNEIVEKIETLTSVPTPDKEILKKSIDECVAYVAGEKSIDETIKAIENKLEIYLAE